MYIPGTTYLHILLHIRVFFINIYYPQYTVLHILSHCTSYTLFYTLFYYLFPFSFSPIFIYIFSCVMFHCFIAYVIFIFYFIIIILFFLHCPLSGPVPTYISLLIIPCMIVYVTNNKEPWTLNLEPWTFMEYNGYCVTPPPPPPLAPI